MNNQDPFAPPRFLMTKEYRRFVEFCEACRRHRYIGLCYGPPGVGKTLSARQYAQWDLVQGELGASGYARRPPCPAIRQCHAVFYTPPVVNSPQRVGRALLDLQIDVEGLVARAYAVPDTPADEEGREVVPATRRPAAVDLLLVDEADRLKTASLEQLRDHDDRTHLGVVLIGMPGLEKRLARYPQLYSRVGFAHQFRPLGTEELYFILTQHWAHFGLTFQPTEFPDAEAMAAIVRITGGNFRLLQRLFAQMERIVRINELHTITKEVVEAARDGLVIGVV
jgi:DNA transposition AAA+ family ATPase